MGWDECVVGHLLHEQRLQTYVPSQLFQATLQCACAEQETLSATRESFPKQLP